LFNLFNAIDLSGNVPLALEALSPQRYQIYSDIAWSNANFNTLEIDNRLSNLRDGSEGLDLNGLSGGTSMGLTSGLSKNEGKDGKGIEVPEQSEQNRWGFFASGYGIFSNVDGHGGDLQDASFTSEGVLLGLDAKLHENWILGALFSYTHTDADLDNFGSTANVDSYSGGLYAGYHDGPWYGNALFAYTHNDYTSTRNVLIPGFNQFESGNTEGNQYEFNIDGGYDIRYSDRVTWGPIFGLQYGHMDVDSFSELGGPATSLAVGSQSADSLRSRLGFKINYHKQVAKRMMFATELRAQWQHEFLDDSRGISASFIGDGLAPFSVSTTSPERDAALVGLGANLSVRDRYTLFFDYDVQAGQSDYIEQSVKGGLKVSW
jgi:outer membrane autotransporter protein